MNKEIIQNDEAAIFVAEVGSRLVGLVEVYVREDEPNLRRVSYRYGYLQSLMVKETLRGRDIGRRLLETAEIWVREKGATEMRLETWEFQKGPLYFYQKNGYDTLRRTLVRKL